ncbi:MAG: hypothetical protein QM501_14130 [Gimesia sp.]
MSSIDPSAVNLNSSFAGALRNDASVDKQKAEAAQQNMSIDKKSMTDHQLHDVGNAEKSGDRDADGRMPSGDEEVEAQEEAEPTDEAPQEDHTEHPADTSGELGTHLDLDA